MSLEVKDAAFSYRDSEEVFEKLSFTAASTDIFCLLGPNGCGKTTLLKCIAGLLKLKNGDIQLYNHSITLLKRNEIATIVGYIPQEHTPSFAYTVFEVVLMGRTPHLSIFSSPSKKDFAIADKCIERVGISQLRDRRYTELSGGERQMVLIARVLAQEPRIMLLDEPTSHLDFRNQALILRMISRLAEEGLTIIMTSHIPNHAITYASKVALMKNGRFIAIGDPGDVITEGNLKEIYGIEVKIFEIKDSATGEAFRFCEALK
jgi:iron complex transport system ATP-binding protein